MRLKTPAPVPALSDQLRRLLVDGPEAAGLLLRDTPPHDELRALWRLHGDALQAQHPRRRPWFLDRDFFVRKVRGEP